MSLHTAITQAEASPPSEEVCFATRSETSERPNKYHYPEFEEIAGERYLLSLAEKFAPFALWRTWYACVSYQVPENACYVGVSHLVDERRGRVGVKERKIYLDLQALEARGWVVMSRERLHVKQDDGQMISYPVTVKDFSGFYATAHDYHLWLHDPDYLAPERENIPLILENPELVKRLIHFEKYRRLLVCAKPGRKPSTCQADERTSDPKVKEYLNSLTNTLSPYQKDTRSNLQEISSSNISTPVKEEREAPTTIGNNKGGLSQTVQDRRDSGSLPHSPSYSNSPLPPHEKGAERVITVLGYQDDELRQDHGKRGAAAAGIPAEHYARLTGGPDGAEKPSARGDLERPIRVVPASIEREIRSYASQYDDAHLVVSSVTRAKKLYATAEQALEHWSEAMFFAFFDEARLAAARWASKRRNSQGGVTRVPYLFVCLENALRFSLEELVFLRSKHPLYSDYSLWDGIADLREAYQERVQARQTQLVYREWLQCLLDDIEKVAEPKNRFHPTTRT